jgi:hypothetical protein
MCNQAMKLHKESKEEKYGGASDRSEVYDK